MFHPVLEMIPDRCWVGSGPRSMLDLTTRDDTVERDPTTVIKPVVGPADESGMQCLR